MSSLELCLYDLIEKLLAIPVVCLSSFLVFTYIPHHVEPILLLDATNKSNAIIASFLAIQTMKDPLCKQQSFTLYL